MNVLGIIFFMYTTVTVTMMLADYAHRGKLSWTIQTYLLWPILVTCIIVCTREPVWLQKILKNKRGRKLK